MAQTLCNILQSWEWVGTHICICTEYMIMEKNRMLAWLHGIRDESGEKISTIKRECMLWSHLHKIMYVYVCIRNATMDI